MSRLRRLAVLCAVFSLAATAQTGLATLTGVVTDPSGAVVAGAQIKANHIETGTVLTAISSATGNFVVPQMPIGRYSVSAEAQGFKVYKREGLSLSAAQVLGLDISFEVGSATESVTVTADASLLKTETGAISHNVTVSQMQNLPLLPVNGATGSVAAFGFRDPYGIAQMIPGVQYSVNSQMSINGMGTATVQYRIEGQNSGLTGNLNVFTQFTQPSVDSVQEVAVQTSNFAAEFGTVGGGIFNVTMKSGTNTPHGSVYDYMVNEALNAHHPFTHLRDRERRNDWGFTLGGPLSILKLYDARNRTFFFFSFEQFRTRPLVSTVSATVPTQAYRDGDFSGLIPASGVNGAAQPLKVGTGAAQRNYQDPLGGTILAGQIFDPFSTTKVACNTAVSLDCPAGSIVDFRTAFPNNKIPQNAQYLDPVMQAVQKLVPLPIGPNADKGALGNNFQKPFRANRTSTLPSFKLDQNLNSVSRLSFFYAYDETKAQFTPGNGAYEGFPDAITAARGTFHNSTQTRLNYDHTLTPTRVLHIGLGFVRFDFKDSSPTLNFNAEQSLGLKGSRLNRLFPNFTTGSSATVGGMSTTGAAVQSTNGSERRPSATVNVTDVLGSHALKYGAEWRQDRYPVKVYTNTAGNYVFSGPLVPNGSGVTAQSALQVATLSQGNTGFGYANFMLGGVQGLTLAVPAIYRTNKHQWALFVQDSWKVNRKLTLDYGLRWDMGTYNKEDHGRLGDLSLTTPNSSAGGRPGGLIFEANCNCNFAKNYKYGFGPRVGFAYSLDSKTVLRGGLGIVYNSTQWFGAGISNDANGGSPGFGQQIFQLKDGIPSSINPQWPVYDPAVGHPLNQVVASPALIDPNAGRPARQFQWSLSVQREVTRNFVVEVSYVGNRGNWWSAAALSSFNDISEAHLAQYGFSAGNTADRALLIAQIANLSGPQRTTLAARGVVLPYPNYPGGQTVRQSSAPPWRLWARPGMTRCRSRSPSATRPA